MLQYTALQRVRHDLATEQQGGGAYSPSVKHWLPGVGGRVDCPKIFRATRAIL